MKIIFRLSVLMVVMAIATTGCDKNNNGGNDDNGNGSSSGDDGKITTDDPNLEKVVYILGYAANIADQYNNQGLKPSYILLPGTTNDVAASAYYLPNGALDKVSVLKPNGGGAVYGEVFYDIDMGRRPSIIVNFSTTRENTIEAISAIRGGTYDYTNDPERVIAYFGSWTGSDVFTSLGNLKRITNNDAITEQVYNSIVFPNNCYKIIVFGKNRANKLTGKYVGYSLNGKTYYYWCIDSENISFGKQASKNTPYF